MIVFIVPFISPHTLPLGKELANNHDVVFINTMTLTEERRRMGYDIQDDRVNVYNLFDQREISISLIEKADVVIYAGSFGFDLLKDRIKEDKLTFIMSERIFKKGLLKLLDKRTYELISFCKSVKSNKVYLLSLGENASKDFKLLGFNKDKIFRFGYFPQLETISFRERKQTSICKILWVGRMVDFKRPLLALQALKELPDGYELTMIGDGKLFDKVRKYAINNRLKVNFCGNKDHDFVINMMANSDIFLSTSDKGEGWGAVINEGMNCGCAIVCSNEIGCAGTLVNSNNSVIFENYLPSSVKDAILKAEQNLVTLSNSSFETVNKYFNPSVASKRLETLSEIIINGQDTNIFSEGICSKVFK